VKLRNQLRRSSGNSRPMYLLLVSNDTVLILAWCVGGSGLPSVD